VWSSDQSSWLIIQRSRVRFPDYFLGHHTMQTSGCNQVGLLPILFHPEDGGNIFFRNIGLNLNWLHRAISKRRMASSEMVRRVALVRTDVSEELCVSIIRVTRIGELGTALAVTS
jgi:hypothetical protein